MYSYSTAAWYDVSLLGPHTKCQLVHVITSSEMLYLRKPVYHTRLLAVHNEALCVTATYKQTCTHRCAIFGFG